MVILISCDCDYMFAENLPAHAVSTVTILNLLCRNFHRLLDPASQVIAEPNGHPSRKLYQRSFFVIKENVSTLQGLSWGREGSNVLDRGSFVMFETRNF